MRPTFIGVIVVILSICTVVFVSENYDIITAPFIPWEAQKISYLDAVPSEIERKLNIWEGSFESGLVDDRIGLTYGSWHDAANHTYYYRFGNNGSASIVMRSMEFRRLFGKPRLALSPNTTQYIAVVHTGIPEMTDCMVDVGTKKESFFNHKTPIGLIVPQF